MKRSVWGIKPLVLEIDSLHMDRVLNKKMTNSVHKKITYTVWGFINYVFMNVMNDVGSANGKKRNATEQTKASIYIPQHLQFFRHIYWSLCTKTSTIAAGHTKYSWLKKTKTQR